MNTDDDTGHAGYPAELIEALRLWTHSDSGASKHGSFRDDAAVLASCDPSQVDTQLVHIH
jgi:hypothetical protein